MTTALTGYVYTDRKYDDDVRLNCRDRLSYEHGVSADMSVTEHITPGPTDINPKLKCRMTMHPASETCDLCKN